MRCDSSSTLYNGTVLCMSEQCLIGWLMSCDVFLQQHKQEVEAEQSVATALRRQLEEVQQAQQDAAQVNFVMATFSACCIPGTYSTSRPPLSASCMLNFHCT